MTSPCPIDVALNRLERGRRLRVVRCGKGSQPPWDPRPQARCPCSPVCGLPRLFASLCRNCSRTGERDHRFPRRSETIGNDNRRLRFDTRLASVDGASAPPTLAHPVSLWGLLDPALLPGVPLIETTWVPRDDRTA